MKDRAGQTWQFGNLTSGYVVLVVETQTIKHRCLLLESYGMWARWNVSGKTIDQHELVSWDEDESWRRLA